MNLVIGVTGATGTVYTVRLLEYLKDNGEEKALAYYKDLYHKWKKDKTFNI